MTNTSISLTEWIKQTPSSRANDLASEDIKKSHHLGMLSNILGVEYDRPQVFKAADALKPSPEFVELLTQRANELCALKLIPDDSQYPKLRIKGEKVSVAYRWLKKQTISPQHYSVEVKPYPTQCSWSASFIVNEHGISGEIVAGRRQVLTTGIYGKRKPSPFFFDFFQLQFSSRNNSAKKFLQTSIDTLHITDKGKQGTLRRQLGSQFHQDYLSGYFETTLSKDFGFWLVDYNRTLGQMYSHFRTNKTSNEALSGKVSGRTASPGKVIGRARIVFANDVSETTLESDEVLICSTTTPDHVVLMSQAKAIVTDLGSVLSHASVIARELGKPCIVATNIATSIFKNGDLLEVDANNGLITKVQTS